jgi:hypothetical protein
MGFNIHLLPDDNPGYRLFMDGESWCAIGPEFVDPVSSMAGWGDTPDLAYLDWCSKAASVHAWTDRLLPLFADFKLEPQT